MLIIYHSLELDKLIYASTKTKLDIAYTLLEHIFNSDESQRVLTLSRVTTGGVQGN